MATSGDRYLATSGDFFMATDMQPMYIAKLRKQGPGYVPYTVKVIPAAATTPPVAQMK